MCVGQCFAGKLQLESIFDAVIEKFLRRAQNRRRSILVPPASTSAYAKVLPKTMLAAGHCVIFLVYVLGDVLVGNLPQESVSKAVVAKFLRRAKNRHQIARASGQMGSLTGMRKTVHESDGSRFGTMSLWAGNVDGMGVGLDDSFEMRFLLHVR